MQHNRILVLVEVDLDPVPGWGNNPDDYVDHIQRLLDQTIGHYNPIVSFLRATKPTDDRVLPPPCA